MTRWQEIWINGLMPQFSKERIEALKTALRNDSPRLIQGCTFERGRGSERQIAIGCCPVAFCMSGIGEPVDEVEKAFEKADTTCYDSGRLGYLFYNWWDTTPREEAVKELLEWIESTEQAA